MVLFEADPLLKHFVATRKNKKTGNPGDYQTKKQKNQGILGITKTKKNKKKQFWGKPGGPHLVWIFGFSPTAESFGVLAKLSPGALWGSHPARFWQVPRFQVRGSK